MSNVSTIFVIYYCKPVLFPVSLCLKVTVAKRWAGLGKLVKFIGQLAVDAVYGMEKRMLNRRLGYSKSAKD